MFRAVHTKYRNDGFVTTENGTGLGYCAIFLRPSNVWTHCAEFSGNDSCGGSAIDDREIYNQKCVTCAEKYGLEIVINASILQPTDRGGRKTEDYYGDAQGSWRGHWFRASAEHGTIVPLEVTVEATLFISSSGGYYSGWLNLDLPRSSSVGFAVWLINQGSVKAVPLFVDTFHHCLY